MAHHIAAERSMVAQGARGRARTGKRRCGTRNPALGIIFVD